MNYWMEGYGLKDEWIGQQIIRLANMTFICCRTHDEVTSGFYVEADKGFNFSQWDESFVCQKKNHFQVRYCKQSIKRYHYMTQYNKTAYYTIAV